MMPTCAQFYLHDRQVLLMSSADRHETRGRIGPSNSNLTPRLPRSANFPLPPSTLNLTGPFASSIFLTIDFFSFHFAAFHKPSSPSCSFSTIASTSSDTQSKH